MERIKQESILKELGIHGLRKISEDKFECFCVDENCGNSKNEKRRKAGFFWSNEKHQYIYHCFKCGVACNFFMFIKKYFKNKYVEVFLQKDNGIKIEKEEPPVVKISNSEIKDLFENLFAEGKIIPFKQCTDIDAIEYVKSRKIPENKLHKLYFTNNFKDISLQVKNICEPQRKRELENIEDKRLMWMFKDRTENILAIQGRKLDGGQPRYLITKFQSNEDRLIGGVEDLDLNEKIYIVEGFIDSLFLPNCASLNGLHMPSIEYIVNELGAKDVTIVFDNEPDNIQIMKNINNLVDLSFKHEGIKVCLLPSELRKVGKDINDYIKSGISTYDLISTINKNSYSKNMLKIRSLYWK